jgi:hypothetical protein
LLSDFFAKFFVRPMHMPVNAELIRHVFDETMKLFLEHEAEEIARGVNERNHCGRMSIYLQQVANNNGLSNYFSDIEYNRRNNGKIKTIRDGNDKTVRINCDLLLHGRGQTGGIENLIAIEVKKRDARVSDKERDRDRLRALTMPGDGPGIYSADNETNPEHVCGYMLGVFIEIERTKHICRCEYFLGGDRYDQVSLRF